LVAQAVQSVEVPIVAQPNAGEPIVRTAGVHYDTQPSDFAAGLARLVEQGARLVGGCCGTEPPHLQATRLALEISSQR
ncbi:MAG: bifunctional homocysteine S-methyltransferase/methylenetetrahydrofolate reductase, partial [bacterium]|nr:bifunctional homocysteine S-methyltransferase/methylenetetrahydrofolate reductase [bacterium]